MRIRVCFVVLPLVVTFAATCARAESSQSAQACTSSAWTGTVTYRKSHSMADGKAVDRVSGRGQDIRDFRMNYNYQALVSVLEDPVNDGANIAKATVEHTMTSKEISTAKESNSCDNGKTWQQMTGTFTREQVTKGEGKDAANVTVGVDDDGTYTIRVAAPQIKGTISGSESSSYGGPCTKKEGKTSTFPETPTSIDGGSLTSDGSHRIDPAEPNRLSGSYSRTALNVTETIAWNLQKCGAPLRITNLTFEDMKFPTWNDWREISEQAGTIDGNLVKVTATVLNESAERKTGELVFKETYRGDKWDGAKPDAPLQDRKLSVSLDPGEAKDVELLWDTSGYAWYDDGRPRYVQRIRAELSEKSKRVDDMTKNLKVAPKPLVLVHGIWSHWKTFETWQNILTTSHSYDWKAFPVGEVTNKGIINTGRDVFSSEQTNTTAQNAEVLDRYIRYAQEDRNAWHVDVVAHSVGGVIARHYVSRLMPAPYQDGRPQVAHLVMLGTPNMGTPCADVMDLAFRITGKSPNVIRELRQDSMAAFNQQNADRRGVKFSSLAGNPIPTMCYSIVPNDGFVPVPAAHWTIEDHAESTSIHTDLVSTKDFSAFVKPHVAIGPRGDHGPARPTLKADRGGFAADARFMHAAYRPEANALPSDSLAPDVAKAVKLAPRQVMDIEIPVARAINVGLTFMTGKEVSATLYDNTGAVVGKNLAKTPEANAWFRSIFIDKPVQGGTWTLKLENSSTRAQEAVIATWKNAAKPGGSRPVVAQR